MKKLYLIVLILLTFSSAKQNANAQDALPPVEYGTNPYIFQPNQQPTAQPYQQPAYVQDPSVYAPTPTQTTNSPLTQTEQELQQQIQPAPNYVMPEQQKFEKMLAAKHKFALLVPLTGNNADVGKAIRDAALLALEEKGSEDYAIIPIDINDKGAEAATEQAIAYGVEVILGPVFSDHVGKVAKLARKNKIKVLSFSNNKAVAGNGVYIFGLMPEQQVERMLIFANSKGIKNFSAIVPNNVFGHQVGDMTRKYAGWFGGALREVGLYSAQTSKATAAQVIADAYSSKGLKPSMKEAIMIPEGGSKVKQVVAALNKAGVGCGRLRCLGVASWDDKDVVTSGALNGAWYAASPYEDVEDFIGRFNSKYKYIPDEIAALGYDAAALAIEVSPNFDREILEKRSGYKGVKGIYRLNAEGTNLRGFAVYEIYKGEAKVIDGAPGRF